jgi:nicotinate phosphoribosyltransferase
MLQAYLAEGLHETAVFELFVRRLPERRNYLLACGLEDALRYLEHLAFPPERLGWVATLGRFTPSFLEYLERLRFTGDVRAVPEGTPVFGGEPILEVAAPLPEAQLVETFIMNQVHFQTLAASKASRVVTAAAGRAVVDFGLRRMHGTDAGMKAARAFHVAGVEATSNVLAGGVYGIPVSGTMAHSYVQAHAGEYEAFRAFVASQPDTVLLVDTYDTLQGVRNVIRLAHELGADFRVRAVRLDSGDLSELARTSRRMLDDGGLESVQIFASGGLDEDEIARLVERGAPIDGFGVGAGMGVSADAPYLDCAYKLVEYAGRGRFKLSPGKETLPGRKQVFRLSRGEEDMGDVVGLAGEKASEVADERGPGLEGRALLVPVMEEGRRLPSGTVTLEDSRRLARASLERLPERIRSLRPSDPPYEVGFSSRLERARPRPTAPPSQ